MFLPDANPRESLEGYYTSILNTLAGLTLNARALPEYCIEELRYLSEDIIIQLVDEDQ